MDDLLIVLSCSRVNGGAQMTSDFFKGIIRWNIERNDTKAVLPYFYYDNLSMTAIYTASKAAVRKLIPHPTIHPIEWNPGRCLVAISAYEYRKIDDLPYNALSISFLVSYLKRPIPLLSAIRLFTSSAILC